MKIVSVEQMIKVERAANQSGISYGAMMEKAGMGVADWVYSHLEYRRGVVGLVGSGNNGGDTLIALTGLAARGLRTLAFLVRPREADSLVEKYLSSGGAVVDLTEARNLALFKASLGSGTVLLDGMLGTGFHLPLRGALLEVMTDVQRIVQQVEDVQVIAVDCPSGVDCDTGAVSEACLAASHTLTMAAVKQGLLKPPANSFTGAIDLVDIGIGEIEPYLGETLPEMIDSTAARERLPERPASGHKGTFGTALILAGSRPYTGAAYLAGKAAYLAGCGLVNLATLSEVQQSLSGRLIEAVWTLLPGLADGYGYDPKGVRIAVEALNKADSLALGPGWGLDAGNQAFLAALLSLIERDLPTVFDADGLKLLAEIPDWWQKIPEHTILTPHPGEMAILTGRSISEIQNDRWELARHYAKEWGVTLVLKGALTAIGTSEGNLFISPVSDSALGTAGSGDVLTGILGGLLAQGVSAQNAAVLGVWLHGLAGQAAHAALGGPESVTALDILNAIPKALAATKKGWCSSQFKSACFCYADTGK